MAAPGQQNGIVWQDIHQHSDRSFLRWRPMNTALRLPLLPWENPKTASSFCRQQKDGTRFRHDYCWSRSRGRQEKRTDNAFRSKRIVKPLQVCCHFPGLPSSASWRNHPKAAWPLRYACGAFLQGRAAPVPSSRPCPCRHIHVQEQTAYRSALHLLLKRSISMPNAVGILSNPCKSKPTEWESFSFSVGFLYTGYLTLTHRDTNNIYNH